MFTASIHGESLIRELRYNNATLEMVRCPATIWCGTLAYASDCEGEPDISGLLHKYQSLCHIPKRECANADWSCCISIDYWRNGAVPRGMIFAQQVLTDRQDSAYDVYSMPESLYVRAQATGAAAQAAFGKDSCEPYELFGFIKEAMSANGLTISANGAQEIEMYAHSAGLAYAYVPVAYAD